MNIGIIGSGNLGGTLGRRWARNGHQVTFGARAPNSEEVRNLTSEAGPTAKGAPVAEAAKSDILLLATPWTAAEEVLRTCGDFSGKIVIDATNPLLPSLDGLSIGTTISRANRWPVGPEERA